MPRRRLRFRQDFDELQEREAPGKRRKNPTAALGKPAGVPRFLNQSADFIDQPAKSENLLPTGQTEEERLEEEIEREGPDAIGGAALPVVSGAGVKTRVRAYNVTLRGRTDADFSSSFRTRNVRTHSASGCENCPDNDCVRVTGTLESKFSVTTTVTLPSVDDFPDLTPCQRDRVQNAITNELAPHEQEHVQAFRTYNGTVRTRFDIKLCRSEFESRIQELHDSVESQRQQNAQDASDALDPFEIEVDLNCED